MGGSKEGQKDSTDGKGQDWGMISRIDMGQVKRKKKGCLEMRKEMGEGTEKDEKIEKEGIDERRHYLGIGRRKEHGGEPLQK